MPSQTCMLEGTATKARRHEEDRFHTGGLSFVSSCLAMSKELTYLDAIRKALAEEMRRDPKVFVLGEDVGAYGGAFGATQGLFDEFGEMRVIDTPISESA